MLILAGAPGGFVLGLAIWLSSLDSPSPYRRMGAEAVINGAVGGGVLGLILFAIFKV